MKFSRASPKAIPQKHQKQKTSQQNTRRRRQIQQQNNQQKNRQSQKSIGNSQKQIKTQPNEHNKHLY